MKHEVSLQPRRVFTIWPADREGIPATSASAWHQDRHWVVLDITGGDTYVVEGPVSYTNARRRELELRDRAHMQPQQKEVS